MPASPSIPAGFHPAPVPQDTIAALATGHGRSDRALIRLSGSGTKSLCAHMLPDIPFRRGIHAGTLQLGTTADRAHPPFPCLALVYPSPNSYTGEDSLELVLPGNPRLIERIIARLRLEPGVREAEPGEFSARAYLNGKLSLDEAEGVAALIGARTEDQLLAARSLMSGMSGTIYRAWTDQAATLLALVEAGIDFTDQEDVVPISPTELARQLGTLTTEIDRLLGANRGDEHRSAHPRIVLAGPPNAGKSTLFNALLGRSRAITSCVAGTTRDAIAEDLDLSLDVPCGPLITLVDLAGLDTAINSHSGPHGEIEHGAQTQARIEIERADAIVLCDPLGRFDMAIPGDPSRPIIRVRTKADIASPTSAPEVPDAIGVCSLDGWNLDVLRRAIADAASAARGSGTWLLPRHRRTLQAAAHALQRSHSRVVNDATAHALRSPELIARDLRDAVDLLGELVGRISPDDIIGRVFATFCVGK